MPFTTSSCCHFVPSCPRRCGTSCADPCLHWASSPPVFIQLSCNDFGACVMLLLLVQFWTSVGTVGVLFLMLLKFLLLINFMPLANCSSQPLLIFFFFRPPYQGFIFHLLKFLLLVMESLLLSLPGSELV